MIKNPTYGVDQEYPDTHLFFKRKKYPKRKNLKSLEISQISDSPFDQRSLFYRGVWFPPCFVGKISQKKNYFFCLAIVDHFQTKMFKSETTYFHYFPPRIPNLSKYWTSDVRKGGQKDV